MSTAAPPIDPPARGRARTAGPNGAAAPVAVGSHAAATSAGPGSSAASGLTIAPAKRTHWWAEALIIGWLLWVYDAINNLAPLRLGPALAHGRGILSFESSLGISPERSLDRWLALHRTLGVVISYYYDNAHFIVTLGLLGFLWWRRTDLFRPLRNALVLINVLGFVVFWLYPVAPPRMLDGFTDVVAASGTIGSWHDGALASQANQLAAMPSLHIAWALWCAVVVWRISSRAWIRALGAVYPLMTAFAVLATGNHYVLDILAGALVAALAVGSVAFAGGRVRPALLRLRPSRALS